MGMGMGMGDGDGGWGWGVGMGVVDEEEAWTWYTRWYTRRARAGGLTGRRERGGRASLPLTEQKEANGLEDR